MNLDEYLEMQFDNICFLFESGSPQKLRHYTDLSGLLNILRTGYIHDRINWYGNSSPKRAISVVRPAGDLSDIDKITGKKICGYFEIDFDILNDKVKHITKKPINELEVEYREKFEFLIKKYYPSLPKNGLIEIYDIIFKYGSDKYDPNIQTEINNKFSLNISDENSQDLWKYYWNMMYYLQHKEGEERIYGSEIPLNDKYMKFFKNSNFESCAKNSPISIKNKLYTEISTYRKLFLQPSEILSYLV